MEESKGKKILSNDDLERFFYENSEDIKRNEQYSKAFTSGQIHPMNMRETIYSFLNDIYVDGFVMGYPHGTVIRQGERRNYFRGEREDYPTSKSTLHRELDSCNSDEEKIVVQIVSKMRLIVFRKFLKRLKYVNQWEEKYGAPFYDAIAQHYGLMTDLLDITNDFNVAMFFACCVWEDEKKLWRPLNSEECEEKEYGILYQVSSQKAMFTFEDYQTQTPAIIPIGYQPFYRCQKQVGYIKHMMPNEDLKESKLFERYYFKHSVELSKGIFDYMKKGEDIYPNESLMFFREDIENIKNLKRFNNDTFNQALIELDLGKNQQEILELLKQNKLFTHDSRFGNIEVLEDCKEIIIPRQRIRRFNLKNEFRSPERDNDIKLSTRWTYRG